MDPLGYAMGTGLGKALDMRYQQKLLRDDQQALQDYLLAQQQQQMTQGQSMFGPQQPMGMGPQAMVPGQSPQVAPAGMTPAGPLPMFRSPQYQQMAQQTLFGQAQDMMPLGPMDKAKVDSYQAGADRDRAYAETLRAPQPTAGRPIRSDGSDGFPEGSVRQVDKQGNVRMLYTPPTSSPTQEISEMKLKALKQMDPNSIEFRKALGIPMDKPVPEGLHQDLQDALTAIQQGAKPLDVYREMFRAHPEWQEHAASMRRILLAGDDPFADFLSSLTK